jgi:hypothetical protein
MAAIRASIGVALAPSDSNDPNGLLKQADIALYRAKGDGKGAFRFFEILSLPAPICSPVRTLSSDSSRNSDRHRLSPLIFFKEPALCARYPSRNDVLKRTSPHCCPVKY